MLFKVGTSGDLVGTFYERLLHRILRCVEPAQSEQGHIIGVSLSFTSDIGTDVEG